MRRQFLLGMLGFAAAPLAPRSWWRLRVHPLPYATGGYVNSNGFWATVHGAEHLVSYSYEPATLRTAALYGYFQGETWGRR